MTNSPLHDMSPWPWYA